MERTSHEARKVMQGNMNMQTKGIYMQSSGTKEKYMTQKTDHTFVWKMLRAVELSHVDPGPIYVPIDTHTQDNDTKVGSTSTSIVALSIHITELLTSLPDRLGHNLLWTCPQPEGEEVLRQQATVGNEVAVSLTKIIKM
jgi:hypothetical protein